MRLIHTGLGRIAVLAILISASMVSAAPPMADRMPDDTIFYAGWAGRTYALEGSLLGQLLAELPADEIAASVCNAIATEADGPKAELITRGLGLLPIAAQHPAGVCVTAVPTDVAAQAAGPVLPEAALLIDLGKDRQAFAEQLDALLAQVGDQLPLVDATVGDVPCKTFQPHPAGPILAFGFMGDTFFLTAGMGIPGRLLVLQSAADQSLLNTERFAAAWRDVSGEHEQTALYLDVAAAKAMLPGLLESLEDQPFSLGEAELAMIDALGVGKVSAVASCTRVVDRQFYTKTKIFTPAPHAGALAWANAKPLTGEDFAFIPSDAEFVASISLDLPAMLAETRRLAAQMDPQAGAQIDQGLAMATQMLGLSIEDDLLANLGPQFTLMSASSLGGFLSGTAVVAESKDPAALAATIDKFAAMAGGFLAMQGKMSLQTKTVGETTITYLAGIPAAAPAWAVHRDRLIVAPWPQVVEAVIAGPGEANLATDADFREALGRVSGSATMIAYVNEAKILRQVNALPLIGWTTAATYAPKIGLALQAGWMPSLPRLEQAFRPSVQAISADETGLVTEDFRSTPFEIISIPSHAASILIPALGRARDCARQSVSMASLQAINVAILMYRNDFNDATPPDLMALVPHGYISAKILISPVTNQFYEYIPLPADADPGFILAYEKPKRPRGQTPVLFHDGSVRLIDVTPSFWAAVRQSQAAVRQSQAAVRQSQAPAVKVTPDESF